MNNEFYSLTFLGRLHVFVFSFAAPILIIVISIIFFLYEMDIFVIFLTVTSVLSFFFASDNYFNTALSIELLNDGIKVRRYAGDEFIKYQEIVLPINYSFLCIIIKLEGKRNKYLDKKIIIDSIFMNNAKNLVERINYYYKKSNLS